MGPQPTLTGADQATASRLAPYEGAGLHSSPQVTSMLADVCNCSWAEMVGVLRYTNEPVLTGMGRRRPRNIPRHNLHARPPPERTWVVTQLLLVVQAACYAARTKQAQGQQQHCVNTALVNDDSIYCFLVCHVLLATLRKPCWAPCSCCTRLGCACRCTLLLLFYLLPQDLLVFLRRWTVEDTVDQNEHVCLCPARRLLIGCVQTNSYSSRRPVSHTTLACKTISSPLDRAHSSQMLPVLHQ